MGSLPAESEAAPFVRHVLGCNCPEGVFRTIESRQEELLGVTCRRVLVGNRLLIHLVGVQGRSAPAT